LKEIQSQQIGADILEALKKTDPVAYVRFASVYKKFDSLDDFRAII
jgi:transcriptional repressor NrdR